MCQDLHNMEMNYDYQNQVLMYLYNNIKLEKKVKILNVRLYFNIKQSIM